MKYFYIKRGFTLIELLVVIAIISILTAIVTANFASSKAKSRDARRISDIAQIHLSLEMAFDRCNAYPSGIDAADVISANCKDDSNNPYTFSYFISKVPTDLDGTSYWYTSLSGNKDYLLGAQLEENSSVMVDSASGNITIGGDTKECGKNKFYCVQPK